MKIMKKIKENAFLLLLTTAYLLILIIKPSLGIVAIKNSSYYIKEMIMIMPVIFVLIALLDAWVSKEKIMKYLGKESKTKGVILSFVLGSILQAQYMRHFPCA